MLRADIDGTKTEQQIQTTADEITKIIEEAFTLSLSLGHLCTALA